MNSNNLLSVLTREGVLLKVSISFWRGCKKLMPEDIGLDPENVSDRLISLGHKRLLPKEAVAKLSLIEGRAHALVEANTFPFLNGVAHFLPNARLNEVLTKLKELETEFWEAKQEFIQKYAELRDSAAEEWRTMAEKLVKDPERLVSVIEASFPLPQRMDRFYGFELQMFQLALPEKMSVDLITMAEQQEVVMARERAIQQATQKINRDVELFVADCVASLREQTAQLCEEMLQSINTSETGVHQKTLNRLVKFIDQFKQLNFANDRVMEQELEKVRSELLSKTAEEYRDSKYAKTRLKQGLSQLASQARQLAKQDASELVQRFGEMGRRKFQLAA